MHAECAALVPLLLFVYVHRCGIFSAGPPSVVRNYSRGRRNLDVLLEHYVHGGHYIIYLGTVGNNQ